MYGPLQLVVVTFDTPQVPIDLRNELRKVREKGIARVVDTVFILKDVQSELSIFQGAEFDEEDAVLMGLMARAFFGNGWAGSSDVPIGNATHLPATFDGIFGMNDDDLFEVADRIPGGSAALFILLEHEWAHGLREAVANSQGTLIAQGWIAPDSLVSSTAAQADTRL